MLSRFSVKKPFTIVVCVIVALILGAVSLSKTKIDLLPEMDIPYLTVITTYPGATAEKVEDEVTDVLEGTLSTVNGVTSVMSSSAENFSMIFLSFEDGTNMDSALVKVSSAVNEIASTLPDAAGTPNYMEVSMDMMATLYVSATYDGKDIYDLSSFVEEKVMPEFERVNGVADVSPLGSAERTVEVRLSDSKIEDINNRLLSNVNRELSNAKASIEEGEAQLNEADAQIESQLEAMQNAEGTTSDQLGEASSGLTLAIAAKTSEISTLQAQLDSGAAELASLGNQLQGYGEEMAQLQEKMQSGTPLTEDEMKRFAELPQLISDTQAKLESGQAELESVGQKLQTAAAELHEYQSQLAQVQSGSVSAASQFGGATGQLAAAQGSIAANRAQLADARAQYESARTSAIEQANIDALVDKKTLAQLIMAQNFQMPAGYLNAGDNSDEQWLLRVGTNITSLEELERLLLVTIDGVGDVRLADVADITVVDNVGDAYMKTSAGEPAQNAVMLSVFKTSAANTSEVSALCHDTIDKLQERYPGLHLNVMSDQGSVILLFIESILKSLIIGALLAMIVLAVFLRDWKPTLVVAFSIPFSVLFSLVLMYFSGLTINIMTLGGISLAIGMLVDNSIIVLENIYRMRAKGMPAPRAAVQGAKQIAGAAIASTLTTICVFLPVVFTDGLVNQLLLPFALTIAYVLASSLLIALTLVPTISSFIFKNYRPRNTAWFERAQNVYGRSLRFFLRHKAAPLLAALALLVAAIIGVVNMGIVLIPTMTADTVEMNLAMPETVKKEQMFEAADEMLVRLAGIEGVEYAGAMDATSSLSLLSSDAASGADNMESSMLTLYLQTDDSVTTEKQVQAIMKKAADIVVEVFGGINEETAELAKQISSDASATDAMSSMLGTGLSLTLSGDDPKVLDEISQQVMDAIESIEGYTEVDNGTKSLDKQISLIIDKDKLTQKGYTVAQLYADLSDRLTTEADATEVTFDGTDMKVKIIDETKVIDADKLLDTKVNITDAAGKTSTVKLGDIATTEEGTASAAISHTDGSRVMTITAEVEDGYNNALLSRDLTDKLDAIELPDGYKLSFGGEIENIDTMVNQMLLLLLLGFVLIYLVMVAQFQSLLSPFIILFTVPLAFTGGLFALVIGGEQLSMLSLMGFAVLMGTIVNNGIVFVDYVNRLRIGGMDKREALVAAGKTRMRPILMTALTTILAMMPMVLSGAVGASMQRGMAMVVVGGLLYATFMTLYIVPIMYDILYRRKPKNIDVGDDIDDEVDDAADFLAQLQREANETGVVDKTAATRV
ncbi:efflux RND transporter permease subunit [Adlercreutzia sp. ZJ141]|uniref:efflux RND transporter permease subunit n=1 Tax=Adlercreutzia sp. ZJ141 TaxID=2709406 RepID=UPI0013EA696C|nr:efflux RND transporter permease subunit [Adlercreutzia sp. ZJ141]